MKQLCHMIDNLNLLDLGQFAWCGTQTQEVWRGSAKNVLEHISWKNRWGEHCLTFGAGCIIYLSASVSSTSSMAKCCVYTFHNVIEWAEKIHYSNYHHNNALLIGI